MRIHASLLVVLTLACTAPVFGQGYGTNSYNSVAPASGGMAGVSLAAPQDVPSAIFGNAATLTQFEGTHFTFGGSFVDSTYTVTHDGTVVPPAFSATSGTQGFAGGSIGVISDLRRLGIPGAVGMGFGGLSGLGAEFRGLAPLGGNITNEYVVLGNNLSVGLELTDRLSLGTSMTVGTAFAQLGVTQVSAMVHDYGLGGSLGLAYELTPTTTVSGWYQSELRFKFDNMFLLPSGGYTSVRISQPETFGLGVAKRLADGRWLLAADILFIPWEDAELFGDVFVDQWAFAFGAQRTGERLKTRMGYSYNTNPINHSVGAGLSGLPVVQDAVEFFQASSVAAVNQHRISGGFGKENVLFRGVDMDVFAGGLLPASDTFGGHSSTSVVAWYAGFGMTWRYHPKPARG